MAPPKNLGSNVKSSSSTSRQTSGSGLENAPSNHSIYPRTRNPHHADTTEMVTYGGMGPCPTLYFSYGNDLSFAEMTTQFPSSRYVGVGCLADYKWFITDRGCPNIRVAGKYSLGFTSACRVNDTTSVSWTKVHPLEQPVHNTVWGLVYALTPADAAALCDRYRFDGYQAIEITGEYWSVDDPGATSGTTLRHWPPPLSRPDALRLGRPGTTTRMLVAVNLDPGDDGYRHMPSEDTIWSMNRWIEDALRAGVPAKYVWDILRWYIPRDEKGPQLEREKDSLREDERWLEQGISREQEKLREQYLVQEVKRLREHEQRLETARQPEEEQLKEDIRRREQVRWQEERWREEQRRQGAERRAEHQDLAAKWFEMQQWAEQWRIETWRLTNWRAQEQWLLTLEPTPPRVATELDPWSDRWRDWIKYRRENFRNWCTEANNVWRAWEYDSGYSSSGGSWEGSYRAPVGGPVGAPAGVTPSYGAYTEPSQRTTRRRLVTGKDDGTGSRRKRSRQASREADREVSRSSRRSRSSASSR